MKTLFKYDLLYFLKTPRLIIFIALAFFLSGLSAFTARYMNVLLEMALEQEGLTGIEFPDPTIFNSYEQFFSNYTQIFLLVAIFIAAGLFTNDKSKNHYPFIFTHAISREKFVVSKFMVMMGVLVSSIIFGALIFSVYSFVLFETFDGLQFIGAIVVYIVFIILIMCFTAMVSFIFKNYMLAVTLSIIVFILLGSFTFLNQGIFTYFPQHLLNYPLLILSGEADTLDIFLTTIVALILSGVMFFFTLLGFKKRPLL